MHEMGIASEVVAMAKEAAEQNGAVSVKNMKLRVGRWSGVECESLRFALEVVCEEEGLGGCDVEIENVEPTFVCGDCSEKFIAEGYLDPCPKCGSSGGELICGDEMTLVEIEVDD